MPASTDSRPTNQLGTVLRSAVLIACLVAILVAAYGLMLPTGWSRWRLSTIMASVTGLALMVGLSSRGVSARVRSADDVALMFGVASIVLGLSALMLIAYGLALHISEDRTSPQALVHQLTHPSVLVGLLAFVLPVAISGG